MRKQERILTAKIGDDVYRDARGLDMPEPPPIVVGHVIAVVEDEQAGRVIVVKSWVKWKQRWEVDALRWFDFIHTWRFERERPTEEPK